MAPAENERESKSSCRVSGVWGCLVKMQAWHQILKTAWDDTWEKVVGQTWTAIVIALLIFIVAFLITRKCRGKEYANDWLFDAFAGISAIIVVGILFFVCEAVFVVPAELIKGSQLQIGNLTNTVASLETTTNALSSENDSLKKSLDKDETVIRAVGVLTGITNGAAADNLDKISTKVDTMQQEVNNANNILYATKRTEHFSIPDSSNATVLTRSNQGPIVFLKLKYAPIESTLSGFYRTPSGTFPLLINGKWENVIWNIFDDARISQKSEFFISYIPAVEVTNLIKRVWTNASGVCLDNKQLNLTNIDIDE